MKAEAIPYAGLIFDQAGNLYGTATTGGNLSCNSHRGCGVVFKLTLTSKGGWKETVLHSFLDHPGSEPGAGLILDASGNLYGTTIGDGPTTFGSVFEIMPLIVGSISPLRLHRQLAVSPATARQDIMG
jgi:uncharacterized repeat protein (TIGR03803 family)